MAPRARRRQSRKRLNDPSTIPERSFKQSPPGAREAWLEDAVDRIRKDVFAPQGYDLPRLRITCGWPSHGGRSTANQTIGETWPEGGPDGIPQIFISPRLSQDDLPKLLNVVTHECVHALVKHRGHAGAFRKVAFHLGLRAPLRAWAPPSDALAETLRRIAEAMPPYPHAPLLALTSKKQAARMRLYECEGCDPVVKIRAGTDDLDATCNRCHSLFVRRVP